MNSMVQCLHSYYSELHNTCIISITKRTPESAKAVFVNCSFNTYRYIGCSTVVEKEISKLLDRSL